jgi:hypothetical protein
MATRFWVGGTGTWDGSNTANWSATSGGASGASVPALGDTINFDANSGSGTCTTGTGATGTSINFDSATLTLKLEQDLPTNGRFTLTRGTLDINSFKFTCADVVTNNANTRAINFGASGSFELFQQAASVWSGATTTGLTTSGSKTVNVTAAATTGTRSIVVGNPGEAVVMNFNVLAGTDTLTLRGSFMNLNLTGFGGTVAAEVRNIFGNWTVPSGVTFTATTSTTSFLASSGSKTITTGGNTMNFPITFNGAATWAFQDALTQGSTRAFTLTEGTVQLKSGVTTTVGSFVATSATQKFLQSTSAGSQATLSQASGTVNATNLTAKDINATGGAIWNLVNGSISQGNLTNWYVAHSQKSFYPTKPA